MNVVRTEISWLFDFYGVNEKLHLGNVSNSGAFAHYGQLSPSHRFNRDLCIFHAQKLYEFFSMRADENLPIHNMSASNSFRSE